MSTPRKGSKGTPPRRKEGTAAPKPPGEWLRENLEAVFVAFILALLIRHFCVEAFKIPTGSMQPTLYGDTSGGDRVLVFKPTYLGSGPERWDIIVFRFPHNIGVNYIKRCIGLPGETLRIAHGDIYVNGEIATKPRKLQEHLWRNWPVWPRPGQPAAPIEAVWVPHPAEAFSREGDAVIARADGEAALLYPRPITLRATAGNFPKSPAFGAGEADTPLIDVRLSFRARIASAGTVVFAELQGSEHVFRAEIPANGPPRLLHAIADPGSVGGEGIAFTEIGRGVSPALAEGREGRIQLYFLDGRIHLDVDGEPILERVFPVTEPRRTSHPVRLGVRGGEAAFSSVRIERDLAHLTQGPSSEVSIPEGHYFALGDNTASSADSRLWMRSQIEDLEGNHVYEVDALELQKVDRRRPGSFVFQDVWGEKHRLSRYRFVDGPEPAPFVPREYIVGKAFFNFWPLFRGGHLNLRPVY